MPVSLIIGNWKMNGTRQGAVDLAKNIVAGLGNSAVDVAVCPPAVHIAEVAHALAGSNVRLGAQNSSEFKNGAYTGEIAAQMLSEFDCRYVIVGHSERRNRYQENDSQVANKFTAVLAARMCPILCIGESLQDHNAGKTEEIVLAQLDAIIERTGIEALASAAIAYEPIWAIGTGNVASPAAAQQVLHKVRLRLGDFGEDTQLLYGGSVTAKNAKSIFAQKDINGALVGGASLQAAEFVTICQQAELV